MANPNPKIDHLIPFRFEKGESGNPNGRPRKLVSTIIEALNDNGIENVTKQNVIGAIETLLNCTKEEIEELAKDEGQPMLIRIIASHLIDSQESQNIFSFLLDRAFGTPNQKLTMKTNVRHKWSEPIEISPEKRAELEAIQKEYGDKN